MNKLEKIKEIRSLLMECENMASTLSIELRIAIQKTLNETYIEYLYEKEGLNDEKDN